MTPEQMQQIAEREYPITDTSIFRGIQQEAFIHGLTYSKWVAVEDGCEPNLERDKGVSQYSINVWGQDIDGNTSEVFYDYEHKHWHDPAAPGCIEIVAYQPLPEPYKK